MATPHVAGAFLLVKEAFPDAGITSIEQALKRNGIYLKGVCSSTTAVPRINVDMAIRTFTSFPWMMILPAINEPPASP